MPGSPPDTTASRLLAGLRPADLERFAALRVLVAGDFMLDEYLWGEVSRISPEAPVLVVKVERQSRVLGGAGNVVNNLIGLGAQVEVLGLVGDDPPGADIRQELARLGVDDRGLFTDPARQTTRKTRVVGNHQQIVRIDRESRMEADPWFMEAAHNYLQGDAPALDAIIISDYGKGALPSALLQRLIAWGRRQGLPVVVDPKGTDFSRYRGASVITPNRKEAEAVVGHPLSSPETVQAAGASLCRRYEAEAVLITQGPEGMTLCRREGECRHIPARAREVYDVSGAGDTVAAVLTLGLAAWGDLAPAAALANLAAGMVVGKVGTAPILRSELALALAERSPANVEKIVSVGELRLLLPRLQAQGKVVVFTNGCFDLLHWGHIKFLEASRREGDLLVVALDSDDSVRRVKGEGRPVIEEKQRLEMLAALAAVDYVTVFASEDLPRLLADLQPDVLTKGSNYPAAQVAGSDLVRAAGGRVALIPITDPVSIQGLINQIRQGE